MPKQQKTRRQHTVPRCYLRGFADEKERFFSFNKLYKSSKAATVAQSAQSEFFYDFDPSTLQNPSDDPQWVEKTFALLERRFKEVLDDFIACARTGVVGFEIASYMAPFVAIQWLRTRGARDTMMEMDTKIMQARVNRLYEQIVPGIKPGRFCPEPGYEQALHADAVFDYASLINTAERFWKLIWVVGHNQTNRPYYTSDEPVTWRKNAVINCTPLPVPTDVGLVYAFPLTNEFVLEMFDRRMFKKLEQFERTTVAFGLEDVERCNTMQVLNSTQYVFCAKNEFELAERLCKERPEICDPNRQRIRTDTASEGMV
jgi:hypothetical protein